MTAGDHHGAAIAIRRPTEADQPSIAAVIDDWFGGRRVVHLAGRSWFRHFASSSWLATDAGGRPVAILLGFRSPDEPAEAVIHLLAVDQSWRRRGLGRRLVDAFAADARAAGASELVAVAWPGEPRAIAFFRGTGFAPDDGPGSRPVWGTPAYPDYDGPGDDRIVFRRPIA